MGGILTVQIDAPDLAKWLASAFTAGGSFAFFKPFAIKLFENYLERSKARALIADRKETVLERIAGQNERFIGVLERFEASQDQTNARLDRIEAHLGIKPSEPPPLPPAPAEPMRRQLTDPDLRAVVLPGEPSAPAGGRER